MIDETGVVGHLPAGHISLNHPAFRVLGDLPTDPG